MKLLAAVIAASASAKGHGDHSYATTTASPHTTGYHTDDYHMGSGDYYDDDDMGHGDHGKPDMGHGGDRPNMGCNHEAMKMWKMEMEKWKYQQEEWQREFRMWKMENGGDHHDGHYDDHYDGYHHEDENIGGWMNGWSFDDLTMGMDMSWMDGIWEMLGQEDILCPVFGMIPFDESWGVGTGADWEAGCRDNFRMQRQYEQLIMQAGGMKSKDFAEQWCKLMGEDARKQLDMFGLGMFADSAMPMCKCITATVKDIVDGNMGMEMMANVGQCVGDVQSFIGMIMSMDMDVKVNIDYEIDYSPENIEKAIGAFMASEFTSDINVMDENILTLLQYWDMRGDFKKMGIFEENPDMQAILSALAIVDIYNQNYEEDWTLEHYGEILRNAADWVAYYDISRAIWTRVFENMKPDASQMDLEAYFVENFQKVYAAPTHIDEFFAKNEFDIAALAEKTQAASGQPTDVVDFGVLMMDVIDSDHWDMGPYIALGQAYVDYLLDDTEPQFPGFMWGLLSCLDLEDIQNWSSSADPDAVRMAWNMGVAEKYADQTGQFFMCMMPFNEFAIDWKSHQMDAMNAMDAEMAAIMQ